MRPTTREVIRGNRSPRWVLQVQSDLHHRVQHSVKLLRPIPRDAIGGKRNPHRVRQIRGHLHHESIDCRKWRLDGDPFCCGTTRECRPPTRPAIDVVNGGIKDTFKHAQALGGCVAQEVNAGESIAPPERLVANGFEAAGEGHARQPTAPIERTVPDGGEATGEGNARQSTAPRERIGADGSNVVGDRHARQSSAPPERTVPDGGDAAGEGHARQTSGLIERIVGDGGDAAGNSVITRFPWGIIEQRGLCFVKQNSADAAINAVCGIHSETRQSTAPIERTFADGGDAAGEGHARQFSAIPERIVAEGGDWQPVDRAWDS